MKSVEITREFEKLVRAFEAAPVQTRDMVRRQVKMAVRDVREYARDHHRFVTRSGMTEKSIMSEVKENQGTVYLGSSTAVFQHEGTKAHLILPRSKKVLRFAINKSFVFSKRVRHPGIKADHFLYTAADVMQPTIEARFKAALDNLVEDL
jgi:hypothetical protein|nr:MAG TPA: Minor capsid protein [Caudoviricetes sp.]